MAVTAGIVIGGAAIGAIGQGLSNRSASKAQRAFNHAQRKMFERQLGFTRKARAGALKQLTPDQIASFMAQFRQMFGNELQASLGQNFSSQIAAQLARRGLTGTGIGTALQIGAQNAPAMAAFQQALLASQQLASQRANAFLGTSTTPPAPQQVPVGPFPNPVTAGLNAGLGAGSAFAQLNQQPSGNVNLYPSQPPSQMTSPVPSLPMFP